jgi:26S proteasome regulatory subunit T5
MSTLEDLEDLERHEKEEKKDDDKKKDGDAGKDGKKSDGDADMEDAEPEEPLDEEILNSSTRDIVARRRLLENDMRIMKSEFQRLTHEKATMNEKIKDNLDKIENNRYASYNRLRRKATSWSKRQHADSRQATPIPGRQRCRNTGSGRLG